MTFVHKFSPSLSCTITVSDTAPAKGESHIQDVEWTGKPRKEHIREYVQWCHVVNDHLAKEWGDRILHIIETEPDVWEFWVYSPEEPPKLVEKKHGLTGNREQ